MQRIQLLLFWTLLLATTFWAHVRWQAESGYPALLGESGLQAWDWMVWDESPEGLRATHIYRTAMNSPGSGIQAGDLLRKVEYKPVPDALLLKAIHHSSAPGNLLIYQIEREDRATLMPIRLNYFVSLSFTPFFTSPQTPWIWNLQTATAAILAFLALLILLILFPLFRNNMLYTLPVFLLVFLTFLCMGFLAFRDLRIRLELPSALIRLEQVFIISWVILTGLLSIISLYALSFKRTVLIPSFLILIGFSWKISYAFWQMEDFREHMDTILSFSVFFISLHSLLFLMAHRESGPVAEIVLMRIVSCLLSITTLALSLVLLLGFSELTELRAYMILFVLPLISLPMLDLSASRIKFGKTTLVLTRTIQYLLFAASVLSLYLLVHFALNVFYPGAPYLNIIEIIILVFLVLLFRGLYHRYKSKILQIGISFQQRQAEDIQLFMAKIPRYTHSQTLIHDCRSQVIKNFNALQAEFWLNEMERPPGLPESDILNAIFNALKSGDIFWSGNKELSPKILPAHVEQELIQGGWMLVIPLKFSSGKSGLLLMGKKKKGVYNLEDVDLLKRLNTQVWLTLDILYLLENEKLLMQKTMEANLTALRSQINPHFLFNTLNTIASLIHDNPEMAELAVENLAFIFRYTLKTSGENFVTVENEMNLVRKYLEIEKFRFGDNLEVNIEINPACLLYAMPALVIQTIVENCIKHGITKIVGKGVVSIRIYPENECFLTVIEDNGPGIRSDRILKGTGLNNIHSRLLSLYDRKDMVTFENTGQGTRVILTLPKQPYEK